MLKEHLSPLEVIAFTYLFPILQWGPNGEILEKYLSRPTAYDVNPTDEFLSLSGAWNDDRTADEIIDDIRKKRSNSTRFSGDDRVFD